MVVSDFTSKRFDLSPHFISITVPTFTPSPIISPIYGILDKNYKKEEPQLREMRVEALDWCG